MLRSHFDPCECLIRLTPEAIHFECGFPRVWRVDPPSQVGRGGSEQVVVQCMAHLDTWRGWRADGKLRVYTFGGWAEADKRDDDDDDDDVFFIHILSIKHGFAVKTFCHNSQR